jgi:hypothetical protein
MAGSERSAAFRDRSLGGWNSVYTWLLPLISNDKGHSAAFQAIDDAPGDRNEQAREV